VTVLADADWAWILVGVAVAVPAAIAGALFDAVRAALGLAANDFGLCRLGPGATEEALTSWLHRQIQKAAGRAPEQPLTFADLWLGDSRPATPDERLQRLKQLSGDANSRAVDLQMMTTDLTHRRPLRLAVPYVADRKDPVLEDERGGLLFDPQELAQFFPRDVIAHLEMRAPATGPKIAAVLARDRAERLMHFPIGPDLPVVVATRMTLSFPVLISAVPLYEVQFRAGAEPQLVRVVFSDGGITSNFPIHFFDSALPTRPTFGLNLTGVEPGHRLDPEDPCAAVRPPGDVEDPAYQPVANVTSMGSFLVAIKDAMQNWRDNAQARLPGFRDRVVNLELAANEGGLNLAMTSQKIEELSNRGRCAGEALVDLFAGDGTSETEHWNDHRFVRYRTSMSLVEGWLRGYRRGYTGAPDSITISYPDRVALGMKRPYAFPSRSSMDFAKAAASAYVSLVDGWDAAGDTLEDEGVPRPPSTLRAVPRV
jgi:hypothetical protein